jgi:hypothetical protein
MNENAETKICPFCAEAIKVAAKKCPFCNSRVGYWAPLRDELMVGIGYAFILAGCVFVLVKMAPEENGRSFAQYRGDLEVGKVGVAIVKSGTSAFDYSVSGFVTNKGKYPWRILEFELTLTNAAGANDAKNKRIDDTFVVQPHTEHAFAFRAFTTVTNEVLWAQARVANAQDGNVRSSGSE